MVVVVVENRPVFQQVCRQLHRAHRPRCKCAASISLRRKVFASTPPRADGFRRFGSRTSRERASVARRAKSLSFSSGVGGGIFFATNSIALSSNMPSGSPVFLSCKISPPNGSGVFASMSGDLQRLAVCDRAVTIGPRRGRPDCPARLCPDPRGLEKPAASRRSRSSRGR